MKKLLFFTCLLGAIGQARAMDDEILYEKDGVVIIRRDVNEFRSGGMSKARFDALHPTMAVLIPELKATGYDKYTMAARWMPSKVHEVSDHMLLKFAEPKAQGPQPVPSAPENPPSPSVVSTPHPTPAPEPAITQPPVAPPIKKSVIAQKSSASATHPVPTANKSTVIVDIKYSIGALCAVLTVWIAYKWYEAWSEDNDNEGENG